MNNPNPFLPQGSFLEQKNKARTRLKIAVYFSISLSVMALMALLIQGCQKPKDTTETADTDTNSIPQLPANPLPDTNVAVAPPGALDTNPPMPVPLPPPPPPQIVEPIAPPSTQDYTVIKNDTLAGIAKKSNVSLRALEAANPGVDAKRLKIGQKLHLPSANSNSSSSIATPSMNGMADTSAGGVQTYKVKSNDTLTGIAKRFHVTIKSIQSANKLSTTSIKVGQVLKIPGSSAPAPVPAPVEVPPPAVTMPNGPSTSLPPTGR